MQLLLSNLTQIGKTNELGLATFLIKKYDHKAVTIFTGTLKKKIIFLEEFVLKDMETYVLDFKTSSTKRKSKKYLDSRKAFKFEKNADSCFSKMNYKLALEYYKKVDSLKEHSNWAKSQISRIKEILIHKKAKNDKQYRGFITKADSLFVNKKYKEAIIFYEKALKLFSLEGYPYNQIALCKELLSK